jgi:hypothetical protein
MKTQLCIGPMSDELILVADKLSKKYEIDIPLIASRNQVDYDNGYVCTTLELNDKLNKLDNSHLKMCRDHAGPFLKQSDKGLNIMDAMSEVMKTIFNDIINGFTTIHIDPSVGTNMYGEATYDQYNLFNDDSINYGLEPKQAVNVIISRSRYLFEYAQSIAKSYKVVLNYEFGTEEQNGNLQDIELMNYFLSKIKNIFRENLSDWPVNDIHIVCQTGTLVSGVSNIGKYPTFTQHEKSELQDVINLIHAYGFKVKEHNLDYLPEYLLHERHELCIDASNVAPEFGVTQTRTLLNLFGKNTQFMDCVTELVNKTNMWKKWLPADANDIQKIEAALHYDFTNPQLKSLLTKLSKSTPNYSEYIQHDLEVVMNKYLHAFNLIESDLWKIK